MDTVGLGGSRVSMGMGVCICVFGVGGSADEFILFKFSNSMHNNTDCCTVCPNKIPATTLKFLLYIFCRLMLYKKKKKKKKEEEDFYVEN